MLISQEANNYVAGQVLVKKDINGNVVALQDSNGATISEVPLIGTNGNIVSPSTGTTPAKEIPFRPLGGGIGAVNWSLPQSAVSETVTLTGVLKNGTSWTASDVLLPGANVDWPINLLNLVTLTWSSSGPSAILEVL